MRIWFVLRHRSMFRFLEPVVEQLVRDGHDVRLSFALADPGDATRVAGTGVQLEQFSVDERSRGARRTNMLRTLSSYVALRRHWPPLLRRRWLEQFPTPAARLIQLADRPGLSRVLDSKVLARSLRALASASPPPQRVREQLRRLQPQLVVASPIIFPGSREVDAIRAAASEGIPTAGVVLSWDNLSSKGLFHAVPDRVYVWNDDQRDEAVRLHDLDPQRIEVVGAPAFDYLFEERPTPSRDELLRRLGLATETRYVLYAGTTSIGLGPGGETTIVRELQKVIAETRWSGSAPTLVVRPHPKNPAGWDTVAAEGVLVAPGTAFPDSDEEKNDLAATVRHADAVVALNTSLFIDAAILGTPTIALSLPRERALHRDPSELRHFEHLIRAGFLERASSVNEVVVLIERLRSEGDQRVGARTRFIERFIRPHGLDRPAASILADRLASSG